MWLPFRFYVLTGLITFVMSGCAHKFEHADLVVHNARIHSLDPMGTVHQAMAVKDGKIIEMGPDREILNKYRYDNEYDAGAKVVYPGFIDAHCHFYGYGLSLQQVDLVGTTSFDDVLQKVAEHHEKVPSEWITGRGWDQNDWEVKEFPDRAQLDELFPDNPVLIRRVDGHAALANTEALHRAGIIEGGPIPGGLIEVNDGRLTGILVDNAVDSVMNIIPPPTREEQIMALKYAQRNCFSVGLTTVDDAGLDKDVIYLIDSLHKTGELEMRIYAMASDNPENLAYWPDHGHLKTDRLNVRSFKFYGDGALGSRGACLIHPYSDHAGHYGTMLKDSAYYADWSKVMFEAGFQMNTHCIGDSANRFILDLYGRATADATDLRWRIEHAQVVHPDDFGKFKEFSIVPSVQPTHCTSDMPWAEDRVGSERIKGAYAYKQLMEQNQWIPLGTDFPVEDIDPLKTFYAAVFREMGEKGADIGGFLPDNALTREQALNGITLWAALSNFEETEKGTLEVGKLADFVVLDTDLLTAPKEAIANAKVVATYVNGKEVFTSF